MGRYSEIALEIWAAEEEEYEEENFYRYGTDRDRVIDEYSQEIRELRVFEELQTPRSRILEAMNISEEELQHIEGLSIDRNK